MSIQITNLLIKPNNLAVANNLQVTNLLIVGGVTPPSNNFGFLLEDSSGVILLEDGSILLLEDQT